MSNQKLIALKYRRPKIPHSFVTRFCAYNGLRFQVSVYWTIGPLVNKIHLTTFICKLAVMYDLNLPVSGHCLTFFCDMMTREMCYIYQL